VALFTHPHLASKLKKEKSYTSTPPLCPNGYRDPGRKTSSIIFTASLYCTMRSVQVRGLMNCFVRALSKHGEELSARFI